MAKINANYEAVYILNPSLSEEQIAALVAKFKAVVEANGTVSVADYNESGELEDTTALNSLGNSVNGNDLFGELEISSIYLSQKYNLL